jgi:hypothetical protein
MLAEVSSDRTSVVRGSLDLLSWSAQVRGVSEHQGENDETHETNTGAGEDHIEVVE